MSRGWKGGRGWGGGCARRIMRLIGSWARGSSSVGGGRRGGGRGGGTGGVGDWVGDEAGKGGLWGGEGEGWGGKGAEGGLFGRCGMYDCIVGRGIGVGRGIEHRAWALSTMCIGLPIYSIILHTKGKAGLGMQLMLLLLHLLIHNIRSQSYLDAGCNICA